MPAPGAFVPDAAARPLADTGAARASTARLTSVRQDADVRPTQLLTPVGEDPQNDPFGDRMPTVQSLKIPLGDEPKRTTDPSAALPPPSSKPFDKKKDCAPCLTSADLLGPIPCDVITRFGVKCQYTVDCECVLDYTIESPTYLPWDCKTYTWKASGLCHKPLYFEEEALERYGHTTGPLSQPFVSAAHFAGCLALWPYQIGMNPWGECKYALGYYRPGSCAPWIVPGFPISGRGALYEAAAIGGLAWFLP